MLSRISRLSAARRNTDFVVRQKEHHPTLANNSVRIPKVSKVYEFRGQFANRLCGGALRIATLIGLPIVYSASTDKLKLINRYEMDVETRLDLVLQNADQLFDENHFQEVIDLLNKYKDQDLPEIQWRLARAIFSIAKTTKDKHEKEKQIQVSFKLIKTALEMDSTNFAIHKWMAIISDAAAELQGIKARILQLENIKFHMLEALRLNPEDPTTWHMMGAFEYGLAELSWIQRKLVSTIFASPPTGSFERALEHFEKAESLKEGFYSTNWLMMAKCHIAMKRKDEAKNYLERAANCAVLNEDDKKCKEEAVTLLRKL